MNFHGVLALMEQQPWLIILAALLGVCGGLITTRRKDNAEEAQVAINGLKELTAALQAEVGRLRQRVNYLEAQLIAAGLPVTPGETK